MKTVQKKVCMLGDFSVGKTSLVRRYVEGAFDDKYLSTVGVKVSRKVLMRSNHALNLILWDLAGGEGFSRLQPAYLQGAAGALLICDLTRPETLESLASYAEQVRKINEGVVLVCLANKSDLEMERQLKEEVLVEFSQSLKCPYFITSAQSGENVEEAFERLAQEIDRAKSFLKQ